MEPLVTLPFVALLFLLLYLVLSLCSILKQKRYPSPRGENFPLNVSQYGHISMQIITLYICRYCMDPSYLHFFHLHISSGLSTQQILRSSLNPTAIAYSLWNVYKSSASKDCHFTTQWAKLTFITLLQTIYERSRFKFQLLSSRNFRIIRLLALEIWILVVGNILYIDCCATRARNRIASLLAGVSKLGVIRNNIKMRNIFRERSCYKYTADLSRNRNVFIKVFLRKKKWMTLKEQAVYKNVLSCSNKPTTPTHSRG
jgi:hypothetical protein